MARVPMPVHPRGGVLDRKYTFEYDVGLWTLGTVQVLKDRQTGSQKLCKTVPKNNFPGPRDAIARLRRLEELRHPTICCVDDVMEDAGRIFVISEKCEGGDLADWVVRVQEEGNWLQEQTVAEYIRQALIALAHAHAHKVYHRDLRPSSLGLTSKMPDATVKVMDVGLASILDPEDSAMQQGGSPYIAPEVLTGFGRVVPGAPDIWSIGAIAHSLLVGHPPSQDEGAWTVGTGILSRRGAENDGWSERSAASHDFVKCLLQQAGDRPTAARALQHPWLAGVVSLDPGHWNLGSQVTRELQNRLVCYMIAVLLVPDCLQYREWFHLRQSFAQSDLDRDGLVARHIIHKLLKEQAAGAVVAAALDVVDVRKTDQMDLCAVACAAVLVQEFAGAGQPMSPADILPQLLTRFFTSYGDPQQKTTSLAGINASLCTAVMRDFESQAGVRYDEVLACLPEEGNIDSQSLVAGFTRCGGRGTPLAGGPALVAAGTTDASWGGSMSIEGLGDLVKHVFQTCGVLGQQRERQRAYRSTLGGR